MILTNFGTRTAILEYLEGNLQGVTWLENLETLKNPDYYKVGLLTCPAMK